MSLAGARNHYGDGRRRAGALPWLLFCLFACGARPAPAQPAAINRHSAVFDVLHQQAIVFGGVDESGSTLSNQAWRLTLADTLQWSRLAPTGAPPSARFGHSAIFDPAGARMLVYGGDDGTRALTDLWALSLDPAPAWSPVTTTGPTPPGRVYPSAVYDPAHRRMIVYGGSNGFGLALGDVWCLWLGETPARWEQVLPSGRGPGARYSHTAVFDSSSERMLVFGGLPRLNDLWALSLADSASWTEIAPKGPIPPARNNHSAILDPPASRMIVFGGDNGFQPLADTWAFSLRDTAWSQVSVGDGGPAARELHTAVADPDRDRMVILGGTPADGSFTWALALGSSPQWRQFMPAARSMPGQVAPSVVTMGDTVSVTFRISNEGMRPLRVASIRVPRPWLSLSTPGPFELGWGGALMETLTVAGTQPAMGADSLVIESNDPTTPHLSVGLALDVRALAFKTQVLAANGVLPLAEAASFLVTPGPSVKIERGWLHYRASGSTAFADSTPLFPQGGVFAALLPGAVVTEAGLDYYVRVENSGISAFDPEAAPGAFYRQSVASPTSMNLVEVMSANDDHPSGVPIVTYASLSPEAEFVSGTLFYRRGGAAAFDSVALVVGQAGTGGVVPTATIPDSVVGPRGVEFWARVVTAGTTLTDPPLEPARFPRTAAVTVASLSEPEAHPGGRYRMLSIPISLGLPQASSLEALCSDDLGSYDPMNWRSYRYVPDVSANVEVSATATATGKLRPEPGRAFWLITRNMYRMDTAPIAGRSVPTGAPWPIPLGPGWNQVGDPFDFAVAWSDVSAPSVVGEPVVFDPELGAYGDYADSAATVLEPFHGYFVFNSAAMAETLWIPPREARTVPMAVVAHASERAGIRWRVRVRASTAQSADGSGRMGVDPAGLEGLDALDSPKPPPPPGPAVRLAFVHPEWAPHSVSLQRDVRGPGEDGRSWQVEITSSQPSEPVTVECQPDSAYPANFGIRLLDLEQGSALDLRVPGGSVTPADYRLISLGPTRPYRLSLLAGPAEFLDRSRDSVLASPDRVLFDPATPNPFTSVARFRFGLAHTAGVRLEIFDLIGRRVANLADGTVFSSGFHTLLWDGRGLTEAPLPSGVYYARFRVGAVSLTRRLVRLR